MAQHFHYRIAHYLRLLRTAEGPITSAEFCRKLAIKPRTLRSDLSRYKIALRENGVQVDSRPGVGYQLIVLDQEKYRKLINTLTQSEQRQHLVAPIYHQERVDYITRFLLSADGYIKLDELAEAIYVSRSTLNSCMKDVRKALAEFALVLQVKTACGVKIKGKELNIRQAMAKYFFYDSHGYMPVEGKRAGTRRKIAAILAATLKEGQLTLTDTGFQNLVVHLEIALMRLSHYCDDLCLPAHYAALKMRAEYRLSETLVTRIEQAFAVSFPAAERYFVAIHLAGKRSLHHHQTDAATPDIVRLFDKINLKIAEDFSLDLSGDFELFHLLSLHLIPMMDRLSWDLKVNNPLLEEIKLENLQAFEMAVLAGKVIQQESGLAVNEAEIGYLAIHFALAIERRGRNQQRYHLLLVCASGMGSSQLLLYRIRQRFAHAIKSLKVVQLYELATFDLAGYDMILSTVDVPFATAIPVLRVNYFFDAQELNRVERWLQASPSPDQQINRYFDAGLFFTDLHATERYQLLTELCQRIALHTPVSQDFLPWVIEREKLSATAFGHGIAFPHPLHPCGDKTFVAVALLKKPICWDKHDVRYVFMLNIRKGEQESLQRLHESLIAFMDGENRLAQLDSSPTFTTLMALLTNAP